jgi:hypothetical protein
MHTSQYISCLDRELHFYAQLAAALADQRGLEQVRSSAGR